MPLPTYIHRQDAKTWRDYLRPRYFITADRPIPFGLIEAAAFTKFGAKRLANRVGGWAPVPRMQIIHANYTRRDNT